MHNLGDKAGRPIYRQMLLDMAAHARGPYNYPWTEDFSAGDSDLLAATLKEYPHPTPYFVAASTIEAMVMAEQGAVMNGTARDLLLYIKLTTMLYTRIGYALQVLPTGLQAAASAYVSELESRIKAGGSLGQYPVNGPVEIPVTSTDQVCALKIAGAEPPSSLSVCNPLAGQGSDDLVLWADCPTFPGTPGAGGFFEGFGQWLLSEWASHGKVVRAEWSKGWAYSEAGP